MSPEENCKVYLPASKELKESESHIRAFDWELTGFEGVRRERWSQMPLEDILLAIEEMEDISRLLASTSDRNGQSTMHNDRTGMRERGHEPGDDGIKE